MSTRDERRRARRMAAAVGNHWIKAAGEIEERIYMAVRVTDLKPGIEYPPSDVRQCGNCHQHVSIDKRLIPLADRARAIACNICAQIAKGMTAEQLVLSELNRDNGEEI